MRNSFRAHVATVLAAAGIIALMGVASVQSQEERTTVFIMAAEGDDSELRRRIIENLNAFRAELTAAGRFRIAANQEIEQVLAECRIESGLDATEQRRCQLNAARIAAMDHVLELRAHDIGRGVELSLHVVDARDTQELYVALERLEASSDQAVGRGLVRLAEAYTRWVSGVDEIAGCFDTPRAPEPPIDNQSVGAVLEVLDVEPRRVGVEVGGRIVGYSPAQIFGLPSGRVDVRLVADGFAPVDVEADLTEGEVTAIPWVELQPLPGEVVVTSSVIGADVSIDGRSRGAYMGEPLALELPPGTYAVAVARDGYSSFETRVEVRAGAVHAVEATLDAIVCGNGRLEPGESCDDGNTASGDGCSATCEREAPGGFVLIDAGSFTMGSPRGEPGRDDDEGQHRVTLTRDFWLQSTEVTQGEWESVMGTSPSYFAECGADCPVERVSWWDALGYLNELSRREGLEECYEVSGCRGTIGGGCDAGDRSCVGSYKCDTVRFAGLDCEGYRLPTESEWEYAARAGSTTALYTGAIGIEGRNDAPALDPIAWYGGNSGVTYGGAYDCSGWIERQYAADRCGPHPVGEKAPNDWGLYDMLGNVYEWTWDWYGDYPSDGVSDPLGTSAGSFRVYRGGSWSNYARRVRSAFRPVYAPTARNSGLGFRPARSN